MSFESIHNYYEILVIDRIKEALAHELPALTEDLLDDIACVALNNLPPRYVRHSVDFLSHLTTAETDDLYRRIDQAILNAAELVKTRRREPSR